MLASGESASEQHLAATSRSLCRLLVTAAVVILPLVIIPGAKDSFRTPKDVLFITCAIAIAVVSAVAAFAFKPERSRIRTVPAFAAITSLWAGASMLTSHNRALSLRALVWVLAAAAIAVVVDNLARRYGSRLLIWTLPAAVINGTFFLLQRSGLWNPIQPVVGVPEHFRFTALIGNPDDVGSYLLVPALVAVALFLTSTKRRAVYGACAIVLVLATATGQLTPAIACAVGLLTMGFMKSRRLGTAALICVVVAVMVLFVAFPPLTERAQRITAALKAHNYNEAVSGRVIPAFAALSMARQNPLLGVGPGAFAWDFFDHKLEVERSHPELGLAFSASYNFGEAHNEYLQSFAEVGLPGPALLVASLIIIGAGSLRGQSSRSDPLAATLSLPLAAATGVLWVAQFPLHLSAPLLTSVYVGSICVAMGPLAHVPFLSDRRKWWPERSATRAAAAAVLLVAIVSVSLWTLPAICYWPLIANVRKPNIVRTTELADRVSDDVRKATLVRSNVTALRRLIAGDPTDADLYLLLGANYRLIGLNDQAAATYEAALEFNRRPEIFYELGSVELLLNRRQTAIEHLVTAARFSRQYLSGLPEDVKTDVISELRRNFPYLLGI